MIRKLQSPLMFVLTVARVRGAERPYLQASIVTARPATEDTLGQILVDLMEPARLTGQYSRFGALLDPRAPDVGEPLPVEMGAMLPLTPRELEVLAAMADGASNKAIARRLGISFHTAKFHVAAILAKLDADSRTEAVTKAAHLGLVML